MTSLPDLSLSWQHRLVYVTAGKLANSGFLPRLSNTTGFCLPGRYDVWANESVHSPLNHKQHCQPAPCSRFGITEQPTERHHGTRFQYVNFIFGFSRQHDQAIAQCAQQRAS